MNAHEMGYYIGIFKLGFGRIYDLMEELEQDTLILITNYRVTPTGNVMCTYQVPDKLFEESIGIFYPDVKLN